jgi:hypothetical protein
MSELRDFVYMHRGAHMTSRTPEEISEDEKIEEMCMNSLARSLERRGPKRIKWGLVLKVAETELSAHDIKTRRFSFEFIQEILIAQRPRAEFDPA